MNNDDWLKTIFVNPFFIKGCMNLQVESVFSLTVQVLVEHAWTTVGGPLGTVFT